MPEAFNNTISTDFTTTETEMYQDGRLITFQDGTQELENSLDTYQEGEEDDIKILTDKDQLDLLAHNYYKEDLTEAEKYWWVIARANQEIENPLYLEEFIGQEILIPNISKFKLQL